ncbi:filamentous hemagglutinin N-terminal domain-containing protein [Thioclava sp. GXIMD4216]|uniref:filamentous hemagglutinin N-terminal domain-containing protein n=1 Tax=Thioclava sp. GXIMD4216 TaxID=3131929 RepID=UPI0030D0442B
MRGIRGLAVISALALSIGESGAQVVPDGSTDTVVTLGADGSVGVALAPATSNGVSLNRYDAFNVAKPGVQLDNRTTAARTIVNEVTGPTETKIEGPLEVLGQRAHIIVANPNGITIDGGRFINTGRVALTTGAIGSTTTQVAPMITREDVTTTVANGRIHVLGGGLSGQMDALELIAHDLRIEGPITNAANAEDAAIKLRAGNGVTTFDSGVLPGNAAARWATTVSSDSAENGAVLVDLLAPGVLRSNRIEILVNGAGAGVRMAGAGYADAQDFVLRTDGRVEAEGATLTAADGLSFAAETLDIRDSTITTAGVLALASDNALNLTNSMLQATTGSVSLSSGDALVARDSEVTAAGHLLIDADRVDLAASEEQHVWAAQGGSLVLSTSGTTTEGDLTVSGVLLQGALANDGLSNSAGVAAAGAATFSIAGDVNLTSTENALGVLFAPGGDLQINAGGDLGNLQGRIIANGDLRLTFGGDLNNRISTTDITPEISSETRRGKRLWYTLWLMRERIETQVYDFGPLLDADRSPVLLAGNGLTITADNLLNQGGEIAANGGDLHITATNIETRGAPSGRLALRESCAIICSYETEGEVSVLGGRIAASGDVSIAATDRFANLGGQVQAIGGLTISAVEAETTSLDVPVLVSRPAGLYNFWRSKAAWIFLRDQFGTLIAETGQLHIASSTPLRIDGGEIAAGGEIVLDAGKDLVRAPGITSQALNHRVGLLRKLPLIND